MRGGFRSVPLAALSTISYWRKARLSTCSIQYPGLEKHFLLSIPYLGARSLWRPVTLWERSLTNSIKLWTRWIKVSVISSYISSILPQPPHQNFDFSKIYHHCKYLFSSLLVSNTPQENNLWLKSALGLQNGDAKVPWLDYEEPSRSSQFIFSTWTTRLRRRALARSWQQ